MPIKETIISEEQLGDAEAIAKALFDDENDPRSASYERKLARPSIRWSRVILYLLAPIAAAFLIIVLCRHFKLKAAYSAVIVSAVLLAYFIATLNRAVVCAIKIYQRYAPDRIRNKCRFEPSCSEYMILAIGKHGLIKGVIMGFRRLSRCNTSGGGFDYP